MHKPLLPVALIAATMLALAGCAAPSPAPEPTRTPSADASAYCVASGGTVQSRQPSYGTNNDQSTWVAFGEPIDVCRFQTLDDSDDSRIYIDLASLDSANPTLAALAYLAKAPMPDAAGGNPATALCTSLGGASGYGTGANGGGLVNLDDPIDVIITPCVFADQSFIEEWGIAYYTEGTVRGADLSKLFRFDTQTAPAVF
jgi:putative hemolysin